MKTYDSRKNSGWDNSFLFALYFGLYIILFILKTLDYVWTYAQSCEHFIIFQSMDI